MCRLPPQSARAHAAPIPVVCNPLHRGTQKLPPVPGFSRSGESHWETSPQMDCRREISARMRAKETRPHTPRALGELDSPELRSTKADAAATRARSLSRKLLRTKERNEGDRERVLILACTGCAALKERLVGPVAAIL